MVLHADNLNFVDGSNHVMQFYNGLLILDNSIGIRSTTNNFAFIQQASTTGSMMYPIYVDNTNSILLGSGTAPVKMGSLVLNGATVSYGANDSGGTGYRCLRVSN